jgi:hypothetical protein
MAFVFSGMGANAPFYVAALITLPAVFLAWAARGSAPARMGDTAETIHPH